MFYWRHQLYFCCDINITIFPWYVNLYYIHISLSNCRGNMPNYKAKRTLVINSILYGVCPPPINIWVPLITSLIHYLYELSENVIKNFLTSSWRHIFTITSSNRASLCSSIEWLLNTIDHWRSLMIEFEKFLNSKKLNLQNFCVEKFLSWIKLSLQSWL